MKLFIRDHIGLIIIQCVQVVLFALIIFLSGYRNDSILAYAVIVSLLLFGSYLAFRYYQRRHIYQKVTSRPSTIQELTAKTDSVPLGEALDEYHKSQYELYMQHLKQAADDQANHLKFIDRWVHQMKTPLSVIELSAKELDEPDSSNIREETDRLKSGLNTVLYMARMRTIQEDFHIKPVSLEQIIQEVNRENRRLYIRNQVYLHLEVENKNILVETDEKWLFFILDQLLQNAVKYTDGRSNRIDMKIYKDKKEAVIEIKDFGIGIPEHDKKRIFRAFFTGDHGRRFRESTGMGLYLLKEVADYLNHRIEVDSTVDIGTTFRIYFTETQTLC